MPQHPGQRWKPHSQSTVGSHSLSFARSMLSLQAPATDCVHLCMFPFCCKSKHSWGFSIPLLIRSRACLGLYVDHHSEGQNYVGPGGLSSLCTVHSLLMATLVPNRQLLCLWSPLTVLPWRETGEHTFGALGTDGAGTLTEQEISENRLNAECSKEAEVAEHTGGDFSVLGEVSRLPAALP